MGCAQRIGESDAALAVEDVAADVRDQKISEAFAEEQEAGNTGVRS